MTAKELKDKMKVTNPNEFGEHLTGYYVFGEEDMAVFWSLLSSEQRGLCNKYIDDVYEYINVDCTNAPEPEID